MKYFGYINDVVAELTEEQYEVWYKNNADAFKLPEYARQTDTGDGYYVETLYQGALDKDEWDNPMPFIIFYFEDILKLSDEDLTKSEENNETFYFDNYTEYLQKYEALISEIERKMLA